MYCLRVKTLTLVTIGYIVGFVKPRENPIFSKMGKIVILIKIQNFSRSRMTKRTFPFKSSHEIKLPRRITLILRWSGFHVFRDVGCRMTHGKVRGCHMAPQKV